jgi:hypothetical protein
MRVSKGWMGKEDADFEISFWIKGCWTWISDG